MIRTNYFLFSILFFGIFTSSFIQASEINIEKLRTEYTETPLGIDVTQPRFSWQMASMKKGCYQTAYQIIVSDEAGQKVWDSGKAIGDVSLNITYTGSPLKPCTRYKWQVMVWDQEQKQHFAESWFETGLMDPDPKLPAWNGAKWIGGTDEDMVLYSPYLPVFKIKSTLQLDKLSNSTKAGFIYGANDNRLMDRNKNIYKLENQKDSSFILIELDIAHLNSKKPAQLNVFRKGYSPQDKNNMPIISFAVPDSIINEQNQYEAHTIYLSSVLGDTKIYIDGENKRNHIGDVNLNPLGRGGDNIAFPAIAEIGFHVPEKQIAYFSNLQIKNYRSPSNILYSAYSPPCKVGGLIKDALVLMNPS